MKKRYICMAALLAVAFLFGCSGDSTPKNAVTDFSSSVTITTAKEKTKCSLSSNLSGISLTVKSGNTSGITYSYAGNKLTAEFSGITISNEQNDFKESMPCAVYSAIKSLRNIDKLELVKNNGERCFYKGRNDVGAFTAEIDSKSGIIYKIEYGDIGFSAEFSDVNEYK